MKITRDILDFYKDNDKNRWYLKKYFTNTLEMGLYQPYQKNVVHDKPNGEPFMPTVDEHNTYEINSLGFRGKVDTSTDVLGSGCSITFGIGVPENGRWTNILSNKMNKSVMNLGNPGGSVETICNNIIQYCMNNKMPKEVFCLMPDLFRNMVVVDREFYNSGVKRERVGTEDNLQLMFCNPKVKIDRGIIFMEIRDGKNIEDAISPHQLILNSVNFIYNLESFCLTNNIRLHWTTWDRSSSTILRELGKFKDFKLKNFVPFYPEDATDQGNLFIKKICSLNHDSEFKNHLCWPSGSDYSVIDYEKQPQMSHPGIHFQYHLAEFFHNLSNQQDLTK
jgi:hypothetical protein